MFSQTQGPSSGKVKPEPDLRAVVVSCRTPLQACAATKGYGRRRTLLRIRTFHSVTHVMTVQPIQQSFPPFFEYLATHVAFHHAVLAANLPSTCHMAMYMSSGSRCAGAYAKAGWAPFDLVDQLAELLGRCDVLYWVGCHASHCAVVYGQPGADVIPQSHNNM